jgi:hypothetical protein
MEGIADSFIHPKKIDIDPTFIKEIMEGTLGKYPDVAGEKVCELTVTH